MNEKFEANIITWSCAFLFISSATAFHFRHLYKSFIDEEMYAITSHGSTLTLIRTTIRFTFSGRLFLVCPSPSPLSFIQLCVVRSVLCSTLHSKKIAFPCKASSKRNKVRIASPFLVLTQWSQSRSKVQAQKKTQVTRERPPPPTFSHAKSPYHSSYISLVLYIFTDGYSSSQFMHSACFSFCHSCFSCSFPHYLLAYTSSFILIQNIMCQSFLDATIIRDRLQVITLMDSSKREQKQDGCADKGKEQETDNSSYRIKHKERTKAATRTGIRKTITAATGTRTGKKREQRQQNRKQDQEQENESNGNGNRDCNCNRDRGANSLSKKQIFATRIDSFFLPSLLTLASR